MDNKTFYSIIGFLIIAVFLFLAVINYIYQTDNTRIGIPASANNTK